jgi:FdhD protein
MLSDLLRFPSPLLERAARLAWQDTCELVPDERSVPEETPVAFAYGKCTYAVLTATPDDLEDFAIGFSLTEGIIGSAAEIEAIDTIQHDNGVILDMAVAPHCMKAFSARPRFLTMTSGHGLSGLESLEQLMRCRPSVSSGPRVTAEQIIQAIHSLDAHQMSDRQAHAVHSVGFWHPAFGLSLLREDIGRLNAFDKLAGALARHSLAASEGMLVLSCRISVELVHKAAAIGACILVAISAPTALAVRVAEAAGITLVTAAQDGFEVFSHPERVDSSR